MANLKEERQIKQELKEQNDLLKEQERLKDKSRVVGNEIASKIKEQRDLSYQLSGAAKQINDRSSDALKFINSRINKQGKLSDQMQDQLSQVNAINNSNLTSKKLSQLIEQSEKKILDAKKKNQPLVAKNQQLIQETAKARLKTVKSEERSKNIMGFLNKATGGTADKVKSMGKGLSVAGLAAAAIFGTFKLLSNAIFRFSKQTDMVGDSFGSINNLGEGFNEELIKSGDTAIMIGKGLGDVLGVTSRLSSEFGISLDATEGIRDQILDTAKATGLSNDEAAGLQGIFMQLAGISGDTAENLIEGTAQLARQKGVAPNAALKDLAASSETVATFTKDAGSNLFEAAVAARQFGLNIDSVAKSARGVLNIEDSIRAETEASVLLGKQVNLQRARQLAFAKDLTGFQKELKVQLQGIGKFTDLNVFQQESLAKAFGMSVTEVAKLASGTKKLTVAGALAAGSFDDLKGQDALGELTKLTSLFKSLSATLLSSLGPGLRSALKSITAFIDPKKTDNIKKIKNIFGQLRDFVAEAGEKFAVFMDEDGSEKLMQAFKSIAEFVKSLPGHLQTAVAAANAIYQVVSFIPRLLGTMADAAGRLLGLIPGINYNYDLGDNSMFSSYLPGTEQYKEVPGASSGAMVRVHDGEAILNPVQQSQVMSGNGDVVKAIDNLTNMVMRGIPIHGEASGAAIKFATDSGYVGGSPGYESLVSGKK